MSLILVIDDAQLWRETTSAALHLKGHNALTASDGLEGLALLGRNPVDLIILDIEIPRLEGFRFLAEIRRHDPWKRLPVIILTGNMQRENIVRAKALGAVEYLLKVKFSVETLTERVQRWLCIGPVSSPSLHTQSQADSSAPLLIPPHSMSIDLASIPPILTAEQCRDRASRALAGRALSGTVAQVISVASSPRTDTQQLASLIARDPMLSARVLHAANSAAYTSSRGVVTTISDAIRNVGCTTVRNVAAALGIFDSIPASPSDGFNPIRCWQHSFAVAQLCERLCTPNNPDNAGIAYLVGLCHDLGEILFRSQFSHEYAQITNLTKQTGRRRDQVEHHLIGISHAELILAILQQIGLPDAIREPIEALYKATGSAGPKHPLTRILNIADLYANGALLASSPISAVAPLTQAACKAAVNDPNPSCPDLVTMRSEVFALTSVLGGLSSQEESKLMVPLFPRQNVNIRLVRDPIFSSYDPIAAVLGAVANIEVETKSSGLHSGDADGLVIVAQSPTSQGLSPLEISAARKQTGRQDFPILWLVGKDAMAMTSNSTSTIPHHPFPIELASLMDFVTAVRQKQFLKAA